jgi:hypothetical protein
MAAETDFPLWDIILVSLRLIWPQKGTKSTKIKFRGL